LVILQLGAHRQCWEIFMMTTVWQFTLSNRASVVGNDLRWQKKKTQFLLFYNKVWNKWIHTKGNVFAFRGSSSESDSNQWILTNYIKYPIEFYGGERKRDRAEEVEGRMEGDRDINQT
jgi:hypothetical protein